jgi:CBS-domain-containing membrane protein
MFARDVMTTSVLTVAPETDVAEVAKIMLEHRISALPVLNAQGKLVGIVSEGDLINRTESETQHRASWWLRMASGDDNVSREYLRTHGRHAEDVMTAEVVSVTPDTSLAEIAALLEKRHIKRVPVMQGAKLVGIVSRANLLRGLAAWQPPTTKATPEDRTLREALVKALGEAGLPMHLVNVMVNDGVAELWGLIDTQAQKRAAHAAVDSTPGVARMEDHLTVKTGRLRAIHGHV